VVISRSPRFRILWSRIFRLVILRSGEAGRVGAAESSQWGKTLAQSVIAGEPDATIQAEVLRFAAGEVRPARKSPRHKKTAPGLRRTPRI
jgi:hypothetical protein